MFFFIYQLPAGSKGFANSDFYLSLVILLSKPCACGTRNVLGCDVHAWLSSVYTVVALKLAAVSSSCLESFCGNNLKIY